MIYQLSVTSLMTVYLHSTICSWMRRIRSLVKITATSNGGFIAPLLTSLLKLVHFITNGEIHEKLLATGLLSLGLVGCYYPSATIRTCKV